MDDLSAACVLSLTKHGIPWNPDPDWAPWETADQAFRTWFERVTPSGDFDRAIGARIGRFVYTERMGNLYESCLAAGELTPDWRAYADCLAMAIVAFEVAPKVAPDDMEPRQVRDIVAGLRTRMVVLADTTAKHLEMEQQARAAAALESEPELQEASKQVSKIQIK